MIRIAVVDDEKIILNQVSQLIRDTIDEEVILDNFESSTVFFQKIDKLVYDIVFLDIDMPEISGYAVVFGAADSFRIYRVVVDKFIRFLGNQ